MKLGTSPPKVCAFQPRPSTCCATEPLRHSRRAVARISPALCARPLERPRGRRLSPERKLRPCAAARIMSVQDERSVASWITPVRGFPGVEAAVRKRRDFRAIRRRLATATSVRRAHYLYESDRRVARGVQSVQHL